MLLQQTEFPLRTVYNIEQLTVILKSRVCGGGRGSMATFEKSNYRAVNRHSRNLKKRNSEKKTMQTEVSQNSA